MCLFRKTIEKESSLCKILLVIPPGGFNEIRIFLILDANITIYTTVTMSDQNEKKLAIITTLKEKSLLKQKVFDNTLEAFCIVKDVLKNLSKEVNTSGRYGFQDKTGIY